MTKFDTLPEPAGRMWARIRQKLAEAIREQISDFNGWKLSGGTILAAQWKHRRSTDIDLKLDPKTGLALLSPEYDPTFDRRMLALGCGAPVHRQDQIIIPVGKAKIDLFQSASVPGTGHYTAQIHDCNEQVLSNAQILAGKVIGRGFESPTRDLYDVAVAAETDPEGLEIAINCIPEATWQETLARWREAAPMHSAQGAEQLTGVPTRWRAVAEDPASAAVERTKGRRYARVMIEWNNSQLMVTTECIDATRRLRQIDTSKTKAIADGLERYGINQYLDSRAMGGARGTLQRIVEAKKKGAALIYENKPGLEPPGGRKPTTKGGYREDHALERRSGHQSGVETERKDRPGEPDDGTPKR